MKRILFLLVTVVFLFTSCSSDDAPIQDSTLVGTWKLSAIELTTELDTNNDGVPNINLVAEQPILEATLTFDTSSEGTFYYNSWVSYNTRIENDKLVFLVSSTINSENSPKGFSYHETAAIVDIETDITFNATNAGVSSLRKIGDTLTMQVENGFVVQDVDTGETSVSQNVTYVFTKQ